MIWQQFIASQFEEDYFKELDRFLQEESKKHVVYPPKEKIFDAFAHCPFENVKVVILGQDAYHGEGQAMGLAFSVPENCAIPPSLRNVYSEIQRDLKLPASDFRHGNLIGWAQQGILLLNTALTVRQGSAGSHRGQGWEVFSDNTISLLDIIDRPVVFLLWGADAQRKRKLLSNKHHLVLTAGHPSTLNRKRDFRGCAHFSQTNRFLESRNMAPIDWRVL
jgi:uracil-DNA glycosylase